MEQIAKFDHIYQYNESRGVETLHPLVNVIDFSTCGAARYQREVYGFYTIYLKEVKCGDLRYGRNYYDYQEGTLVFLAPGQVIGYENNGQTYQLTSTSVEILNEFWTQRGQVVQAIYISRNSE